MLGLPYIWRGFPFKAPKIIQENVEADVERRSRQPKRSRVVIFRCPQELGLEEEGEENGKDAKEAKEMLYLTDKDHPQGATVIGGLFGPLDQRLLRPMDPLDELKLLKLNFLVMVLCQACIRTEVSPCLFAHLGARVRENEREKDRRHGCKSAAALPNPTDRKQKKVEMHVST